MKGPGTDDAQRAMRRAPVSRSARPLLVAWVVAAASAVLVWACGGSTGREGLPTSPTPGGDPDGSLDDGSVDGGVDATLDDGSTADGNGLDNPFDVIIAYADRPLPDVAIPAEGSTPASGGGMEAGPDLDAWPPCAPDIPVMGGGLVIAETPAIFLEDGGQAPAPDGSVCATHVWMGSQACDRLLRGDGAQGGLVSWFGVEGPAALPPCSDLAGAGNAMTGPLAGHSRLEICQNLFTCIMNSGCFATSVGTIGCLCTGGNGQYCAMDGGNGACFEAFQAALEIPNGPPGTVYGQAEVNVTYLGQSATDVGHAAGSMYALFQAVISDCPLGPFIDAGK